MSTVIAVFEIIFGWIIIAMIFEWMVEDGLFEEVKNLIEDIKGGIKRLWQ